MNSFALIGAAGYIAPRHMRAILETDNNLVVALDKTDSVGIIDSYFPKAAFFTEFERFDRHVCKLIRRGDPLDYVTVCTPNYLHDAHIRFGLRIGADVVCEKPLMLTPRNISALHQLEAESGKKIYTILQLRLHPAIQKLKRIVDNGHNGKVYDVDLTYITSRGNWYYTSWKGSMEKSGGIATNIGIHFFDMLSWIFGDVKVNTVHIHTHDRAAGYMELEKARIRWFLSINSETLPKEATQKGMRTFRSITIDDQEIEFSEGFTDLHTRSYEAILAGNGFGLEDSEKAIKIAYDIRNAKPVGITDQIHPLALLPASTHPFRRDHFYRISTPENDYAPH
jgi:UDP-N-acetyl-2-amino-2-deoxyglucuronate dehydrogenase